ncbi:MAG: hypothetical protein C4523_08145 [Myxococcales bacterium]|nr:MAG: hypothetical protein C4523_08145 [Myxococcales bacterium]
MLPGFNSNIKRGGRIFHVQTEDMGEKWSQVASHLFLDGAILTSQKTSYKDLLELDAATRQNRLLVMMRASHREMVRRLSSGEFDARAGLEAATRPDDAVAADTEANQSEVALSASTATDADLPSPEELAERIASLLTEALPGPPVAARLRERLGLET